MNRVTRPRPWLQDGPGRERRLMDPGWAMRTLRASRARGSGLLVLCALVLLAGADHRAEAAVPDIADMAHLTYETTRKWLRWLRRAGEVTIVRRGGGKRVNIWRIRGEPQPDPEENGGAA